MLALIAALAVTPQTTTLSVDQLNKDWLVLERALGALHPGITLHQTIEDYQVRLGDLKVAWSKPRSRREAYLDLSKFLATIRCGHTYANFYNQPEAVAAEVLKQADKLPFTFEIVEGRMLVTSGRGVNAGDEVTHLQGKPVSEVLAMLRTYVKADGANDAKRTDSLQVSGLGRFEAFDVFFPLLFPPQNGRYQATIISRGKSKDISLKPMSREDRLVQLAITQPETWEYRVLPEGVGYLRLESFTTWNFKFNWLRRLSEAFDLFRRESPQNLIIDIRGNEGGDDSVLDALYGHLLKEPVTYAPTPQFIKFQSVADDLRPHLQAWDKSVFEAGKGGAPAGEMGFYRPGRSLEPTVIKPTQTPYPGKVWLIVGASNSSATHYLADRFKQHKVATLVGQATGGSLKGMNGSQFLQLILPSTGFEVDIPLIANRPEPAGPDQGIEPDIVVPRTFAEIAKGIDPEIATVLRLIKK